MSTISEIKHQVNLHKWSEIIRECQQSGEFVESWCNTHGVGVKSYYYWLRKVRTEVINNLPEEVTEVLEQNKPAEPILPVAIKPLQVQGPTHSEDGVIEICLPCGSINIHCNVTKETIEAAIAAVRSSC